MKRRSAFGNFEQLGIGYWWSLLLVPLLVGATIVLQRRDKGSTKWVNVASAKTNTSGNVSIGSAPSKTADFRLSYSGIYRSPWYAPALTSTKRVSVS